MKCAPADTVLLLKWFLSPESDKAGNEDGFVHRVSNEVENLMRKDYRIQRLDNCSPGKVLCGTYPPYLFLFLGDKECDADYSWAGRLDEHHFNRARMARARGRFAAPVLVVNDCLVSRGATLSVSGEAVLSQAKESLRMLFRPAQRFSSPSLSVNSDDALVGQNRMEDIELLNALQVSAVFDLMRATRIKRYGVNFASSEKADSMNRYSEFKLNSIPYRGTAAFKNFANSHDIDAPVPWHEDPKEDAVCTINPACNLVLDLSFSQYKQWSLGDLTINYLRLLLAQVRDSKTRSAEAEASNNRMSSSKLVVGGPPGDLRRSFHYESAPQLGEFKEPKTGILIHCISGWDRTPLFVCLMRCLAWAEKKAHSSLNVKEFLHLALGYDWLLFRHRLHDRMSRGEAVMYFTFYFLAHIAMDESCTYGGNVDWALRKERLLHLQSSFIKMWREVRD